jgi:multicomponent Na+:H+ antiporter subunit F
MCLLGDFLPLTALRRAHEGRGAIKYCSYIVGCEMRVFFLCVGTGLCFLGLLCLYRGIFGPTVLNRMAGISAIGTKTLVLLMVMGFIYNRVDMFVDISVVYALLNFVGSLAAAKYLEMRGEV